MGLRACFRETPLCPGVSARPPRATGMSATGPDPVPRVAAGLGGHHALMLQGLVPVPAAAVCDVPNTH